MKNRVSTLRRTQLVIAAILVCAIGFVRLDAQEQYPDPAFILALEDALGSTEPPVKRRIITTLKTIGRPAVPLLIGALADPSADVRRDAAAALRDIGKPARSAIPHSCRHWVINPVRSGERPRTPSAGSGTERRRQSGSSRCSAIH